MLVAPPLDDLRWDDLRLLAQRRIPAASGGTWTHHAPVDPGITLIELFAFLLEQQVYVLDQVPDALLRGVLRLLGEAPRGTGIARTVLAATPSDTAPPAAAIQAGSVVRPDLGDLDPVDFTLLGDSALLRVSAAAVVVAGVEQVPGSIAGPVRLMPADGRPAMFDMLLRLAAPAPAGARRLSLLLDLAEAEEVAPQWAAAAADVPPPATLAFARVDGGNAIALPQDAVSDGTLGLRRGGLLTIAWQAAWDGASEIRLRVSTGRASFAEPPRLLRLIPNVAIAEHRVARAVSGRTPDGGPWDDVRAAIAAQLDRWLPLSDQILDLPAALGAPIEGSIELALNRAGALADWRETDEIGFAGPTDRVFTLDRARGRLSFGNGYTGRVPAPADDFTLALDVGGGISGNLPQGLSWTVETAPGPLPDVALTNVAAAAGGASAETVPEARDRVSNGFQQQGRVVTADDIRTLIETMPGVTTHRAHVVPGYDPDFPCAYVGDAIGVFVVPRVRRDSEADRAEVPAPAADPGAMALFAERLEANRLLATRIHVLRPLYRPVALAVTLRGSADADASDAVRVALARHLDPVIGGSDGDGWPFGRALRPSELIRVAQDVAGDALLVEQVAVGIDGAPPTEACGDTPIGPHDLVWLAACRIIVLPAEDGA